MYARLTFICGNSSETSVDSDLVLCEIYWSKGIFANKLTVAVNFEEPPSVVNTRVKLSEVGRGNAVKVTPVAANKNNVLNDSLT